MKNVQSFHAIRFLTKITFVPMGRFTTPPPKSTGSFGLKKQKQDYIQ